MQSFPIAATLNIESNIKSPVLQCNFAREIVDIRRQALEMLIVHPEDIKDEQRRKRAFRLMAQSRVVVTSDKVGTVQLFLMMRRAEEASPRELAGLCEKVVIQLEHCDFQQIADPSSYYKAPQLPQVNGENTMEVLCGLLKTWGNCSDELVSFL